MRPEQLHDVIGELPEELLTPVEALRKKKQIHWARWASLAAACLLILAVPFAMPQLRSVSTESAKGDMVYSNQEAAPENGSLIYGDAAGEPTTGETFRAEVLEVGAGWILVKPLEGEWELKSADKITVALKGIQTVQEIAVGDIVEITYSGILQESYPAGAVGVTRIRTVE